MFSEALRSPWERGVGGFHGGGRARRRLEFGVTNLRGPDNSNRNGATEWSVGFAGHREDDGLLSGTGDGRVTRNTFWKVNSNNLNRSVVASPHDSHFDKGGGTGPYIERVGRGETEASLRRSDVNVVCVLGAAIAVQFLDGQNKIPVGREGVIEERIANSKVFLRGHLSAGRVEKPQVSGSRRTLATGDRGKAKLLAFLRGEDEVIDVSSRIDAAIDAVAEFNAGCFRELIIRLGFECLGRLADSDDSKAARLATGSLR